MYSEGTGCLLCSVVYTCSVIVEKCQRGPMDNSEMSKRKYFSLHWCNYSKTQAPFHLKQSRQGILNLDWLAQIEQEEPSSLVLRTETGNLGWDGWAPAQGCWDQHQYDSFSMQKCVRNPHVTDAHKCPIWRKAEMYQKLLKNTQEHLLTSM